MYFVAGASQAGKSYTLARLTQERDHFRAISASALLRAGGHPLENLTEAQAASNQLALLKALQKFDTAPSEIILVDGHAVIPTISGNWAIPSAWYDGAKFAGFILVESDPVTISTRLALKGKGSTPKECALHQNAEREALIDQSARLNVPFLAVESGNIERIVSFVGEDN